MFAFTRQLRRLPLALPQQKRFFAASIAAKQETVTQTATAGASKSKFAGQAHKRHEAMDAEPTRIVQIDGLPSTVTTEDIRKLAREALSEDDKTLKEIVFCRNQTFDFNGRCVALLDSPQSAQRFIDYGNRRVLGGQVIKISSIGKQSGDPHEILNRLQPAELRSMTDAASSSGRAVLLTGLPIKTLPEHLLGILRSKNFYPTEGTVQSVIKLSSRKNATVAKYLVKFDTESEAWRCVRTFHNMNYFLKTRNTDYKLQASVVY